MWGRVENPHKNNPMGTEYPLVGIRVFSVCSHKKGFFRGSGQKREEDDTPIFLCVTRKH